ncbi:RHS repeat domain-containing protein [Chitinilyticum piscinae]|uniref:RHS repeat domain-containing protein n=1 Tax=Chitinilyticum piscinae TaxID=2866724 RepID=UPI0035715569
MWTYSPEPQPFEQLYYYHTDHLGTPQELLDSDGNLAWSADYKAWGEAKAAISEAAKRAGISNPLRFQGQYFDHETGLHYNQHRYYDPQIGRFISKDPIGLLGGLNVHVYARNPIEWIDPLGLNPLRTRMEQGGNLPENHQAHHVICLVSDHNLPIRSWRLYLARSVLGTLCMSISRSGQ